MGMESRNETSQALAAARAALDSAEAAREAVLLRHIANGVQIASRTVFIDETVQIAPGAVILPGTILRGSTVIGPGCVIGPNALIEDSTVGGGTTVNASQVYASQIGPHNNIGPFTHIRAGTVTDYGVHLGAYVETKNSNFARGNTVSHLTYIGDSDVGKYCNFGCGTVTCNYDGQNKYRRRQHRHPGRARRGPGHRAGPPGQRRGLGRPQDGSLHRQKAAPGSRTAPGRAVRTGLTPKSTGRRRKG